MLSGSSCSSCPTVRTPKSLRAFRGLVERPTVATGSCRSGRFTLFINAIQVHSASPLLTGRCLGRSHATPPSLSTLSTAIGGTSIRVSEGSIAQVQLIMQQEGHEPDFWACYHRRALETSLGAPAGLMATFHRCRRPSGVRGPRFPMKTRAAQCGSSWEPQEHRRAG